jgi:hypothetical protein
MVVRLHDGDVMSRDAWAALFILVGFVILVILL